MPGTTGGLQMKGFKKICLFALSALMLAGCVTGCTKLPEQTAEPQKNTEPVPFLQPASDSDSKAKSEAPKEPVASTEPGLIYSTTVDDLQTGFCVLTMDDEFHITPGEGFTDEVTWISSDEDVAAVNNGVVLPVGQGKADIFFTDGQAAATQHVVVNTSPETASPAGKLLIELKGRLYECGISKAQWDQTGKRPE